MLLTVAMQLAAGECRSYHGSFSMRHCAGLRSFLGNQGYLLSHVSAQAEDFQARTSIGCCIAAQQSWVTNSARHLMTFEQINGQEDQRRACYQQRNVSRFQALACASLASSAGECFTLQGMRTWAADPSPGTHKKKINLAVCRVPMSWPGVGV